MAVSIHESTRYLLDGQLNEAVAAASMHINVTEEKGRPLLGLYFAAHTILWPAIYLGRAEEPLALLLRLAEELTDAQVDNFSARIALCLAALGHWEEARTRLDKALLPLAAVPAADDATPTRDLTEMLAASVLLKDTEKAVQISECLRPAAHLLAAHGGYLACNARHLGDAANLLDKPEEARGYFKQAIEVCEKVRFRPEIALTRLALAELLLEHYPDERDAAIEHLDFAIAEFREMKMQPSLERALRHRGLLKA
jgi:tetratricopeptide (TPR) repeat protein